MNDSKFSDMFKKLFQEWNEDTAFHSSYNIIQKHANHQKIVDLGNIAIPFLLEEISKSPNMRCDMALKSITGVKLNVPEEHVGKTREIARLWIEWGKELGHIK